MFAGTRGTLYGQVKHLLVEALKRGEWAPGAMLPSEKDLAQMFGVSNGTMRKAFDELEAEGVVVRVQGRGTFVKSYVGAGYRNSFHRFYNDQLDAIVPFKMRAVLFESVPGEEAGAKVLSAFKATPETEFWHAIRVYGWGGEDVGISELWLERSRFPDLTADGLARHAGSLYEYYEAQFGVTIVDVRDRVKARTVTSRMAQWGDFRVGDAYLELTRVGFTFGGVPVEYRLSYCVNDNWHMQL